MELKGHTAELTNCIWNFDCSMIATSSLDTQGIHTNTILSCPKLKFK